MDGSSFIFPPAVATPDTPGSVPASLFPARPELFAANEEPSLDDLMADPLTVSIMVSDGVRHERLVHLIAETRARLGH